MKRVVITILVTLGIARCSYHASTGSPLTNAVSLSAGYLNTCAVQYGGKLYCWGHATTGQGGFTGVATCTLSGVDLICALKPGTISGLTTDVLNSSIGFSHSCANVNGAAKCWGDDTFGQLGDGGSTISYSPVDVTALTSGVTSLSAGYSHSCGVMATGAYCWGDNTLGQIGDATNTTTGTATGVSGLGAGVSKIATGGSTSCALLASGMVMCWGANTAGQLGDGSGVASSNIPVVAVAANATAVASSVGIIPGHTCAIVSGGVKCWGLNAFGQLGDGTIVPRNAPVDVVGLTSGVTAIATGGGHTCAIQNGGVKCWGLNESGQLGKASNDLCTVGTDVYPCSLSAVSVTGLDRNLTVTDPAVIQIAAGDQHTCATLENQTIKCWGNNEAGQLGNNTLTSTLTPVFVLQ